MLLSTRNRPKKNGDCTRIGRHELKGLVPSFLYSSIVSWVIAWRDSGSDLPLYFFWIFCSSGWIICILRDAMICLTNSGIIAARMTMTRPTIDRAQVHPEAGFIPIQREALVEAVHDPRHEPLDWPDDRVEEVAHVVLTAVPAGAGGVRSRS